MLPKPKLAALPVAKTRLALGDEDYLVGVDVKEREIKHMTVGVSHIADEAVAAPHEVRDALAELAEACEWREGRLPSPEDNVSVGNLLDITYRLHELGRSVRGLEKYILAGTVSVGRF